MKQFIFLFILTLLASVSYAGIGDSKGPFDSSSPSEENINGIGSGTSSSPFNEGSDKILDASIPDPTPPGDPHDFVPLDKGFLAVLCIGFGMGFYFLQKKKRNALAN